MIKSDADRLRTLIHVFIRNFGLLDQTKTPCGMPIAVSDAHALMELLNNSGIDQMELSRRLGLSKSATSRLLARLVRRNQVKRIASKLDGRAYCLHLTETGKRQAGMINRESLATFKAIISEIPDDAAEKFLQSLALLIKALPGSQRDSASQTTRHKFHDL